HMPYGTVPMIDRKTGELKLAESYQHREMHDTHDYLLPTDAAKDKAIQAWMASERGKQFSMGFFQKRRNSRTESRPEVKYPDAPYTERGRNPWGALLRQLSPEGNVGYG